MLLAIPLLISCALLAVLFTRKTLFRNRYKSAAALTAPPVRSIPSAKEGNKSEINHQDEDEKTKVKREVEVEHMEKSRQSRHAHTEHLEEHHHHRHHRSHHHEHEHEHIQLQSDKVSKSGSSSSKEHDEGSKRPHRAKTDILTDGPASTSGHRHHHHHHHHTPPAHLSDSSSSVQEYRIRRGHTQHASLNRSQHEHQARILPFDAETHDEPATMGQHMNNSSPTQQKYKGYEGQVERSMHHQGTGHIQKGERLDSLGHGYGHGGKTAQRTYTVSSSSPTSSTSSKDGNASRVTPEEFRDFLRKNAKEYMDAHPTKEGEGGEEKPLGHEARHEPKPPAWTVEGGPGWHHRQLAKAEARYKYLANLEGREAWRLGKKEEARMHADRAREHDANFKRYHAQAATEIFASNNPRYSMSRLQRCDLHGLFVEEALQYAQDHLVRCQQAAIEKTMLVVGKGSHSSTGSARIRPAIMQMLSSTGGVVHGVHEKNEGCIMVEFAVARPH